MLHVAGFMGIAEFRKTLFIGRKLGTPSLNIHCKSPHNNIREIAFLQFYRVLLCNLQPVVVFVTNAVPCNLQLVTCNPNKGLPLQDVERIQTLTYTD